MLGRSKLLVYDFKALTSVDRTFKPPKAVADLFDAEMSGLETRIYEDLFSGRVEGNPRTVKFLETVLARYGLRAFCESYGRAVGRERVPRALALEQLCQVAGYSHKARVLLDVLRAYDVEGNEGLKPVLVFTSRKATAYEFGGPWLGSLSSCGKGLRSLPATWIGSRGSSSLGGLGRVESM